MNRSIFLGISAYYHDSAAAIIVNGQVVAAAQEERFTRKKHDASFPVNAIRYCLEEAECSIDELEAVIFYDKPFIKFERLLETYYAFAPIGVKSFVRSMPVWMGEKLFTKKKIKDGLKEVGEFDKKEIRLLFTEHHLSHAASAFYPSPFEQSAILTIDGVGEWATASLGIGKGSEITLLKEMHFPHSLGLLYSAFTYFLGFRVNSGEYKLMGLAPYGNREAQRTKGFVEQIKAELVDIKSDGSIWLNQRYFKYATGTRMIRRRLWEELFGMEMRAPESELLQEHCDLAAAIQQVTEEVVLLMARHLKEISGQSNLCLAGGVALNCVANGLLKKANIFDKVFIQPAAGDAGGALGAALSGHHISLIQPRTPTAPDALAGSLLGPSYSDEEIELFLNDIKAKATRYGDDQLVKVVAEKIADGLVIGWFQGRMEFGPRALGNRSILGDPRSPEMQTKINLKIKNRESFRPFAPSVLKEEVANYFEFEGRSPYMLFVDQVAYSQLHELPADYPELDLRKKLLIQRSTLPAITHVDMSARIQTVDRDTNPRYYNLIAAFKELTGCPVLINTSFNVRGEPIVCSPSDAYECFTKTEMDLLVLGNFILAKQDILQG